MPWFQRLLYSPCSPRTLWWARGENSSSAGAGVQEAPVASGLAVCGLAALLLLLLLILLGPEQSRAWGSR